MSTRPTRVVVPSGSRSVGAAAGAARFAWLMGSCVVGLARVEAAYVGGGRRGAQATFRQIAREFCGLFGVAVEVEGDLDRDAHEVRVANHTSYLDIIALYGAGAGRFLSKKDVREMPMVGRVADRIGTVFVDRESREGRAQGLRALNHAATEREPVVVFPEGRTNADGVRPFARGAFLAARLASVPVRPLAVVWADRDDAAWTGDMTLLPHVWRRLCGGSLACVIRVLPAIEAGDDDGDEVRAERARSAIARALEQPTPLPAVRRPTRAQGSAAIAA
jgi:1-acyl-sn-glycerol-3-phosphate acyltransferase